MDVKPSHMYPAPVNPELYIAPVMSVTDCLLDTTNIPLASIPPEKLPRSLLYRYRGQHTKSLCALWNPLFVHLTALHLQVEFPFDWTHPLSHLMLPNLRYFHLDLLTRASPLSKQVVEASVLTWRFPKLQMFGVSGTLENPKLNAEIAALLFSHAATVEEVELRHFFIIDEVARAVEWKRFTMLKKLHLLNLGTIHHLIPALYGDSSAASSRPLVIHFAAAWIGNEVVGMFNHAIRSHLHAFAQVTFLLDEFAWDDITRAFSWHRAGRMTCLLSPSLETASLAIFDKNGEPLDSPAALRCRQALIKVEAGL